MSSWTAVVLSSLAAGGLLACQQGGDSSERCFTWSERSLSVGSVPLGRTQQVITQWRVTGSRPIEVLAVISSCGCSDLHLMHEGKPFTAGSLVPGAEGEARVSVRSRSEPGRRSFSVRVAWRSAGAQETNVSELPIEATFFEVFQAEPPTVLASEVAPRAVVPFRIRWRALRPDTRVQDLRVAPHASIRVQRLEARDRAGMVEIEAEGEVVPGTSPLLQTTLDLEGVDPLPPSVPIRVSWQSPVTRVPEGLVQLHREDGGVATARVDLRFAPTVPALAIERALVEPPDLAQRITALCTEVEPGHVRVDLRASFFDTDRFLTGSIRIVGKDPEVANLSIPWVYLRPPARPGDRHQGGAVENQGVRR